MRYVAVCQRQQVGRTPGILFSSYRSTLTLFFSFSLFLHRKENRQQLLSWWSESIQDMLETMFNREQQQTNASQLTETRLSETKKSSHTKRKKKARHFHDRTTDSCNYKPGINFWLEEKGTWWETYFLSIKNKMIIDETSDDRSKIMFFFLCNSKPMRNRSHSG